MQPYRRGKSEQLPRRRIRLPHQTASIQEQDSAGEVGKYGGAERIGGLGFSAFGEVLGGKLVFLLLQLLNHSLIGVDGQSFSRQRGAIQGFSFGREALPQAADYEQTKQECRAGGQQKESHAQRHRIYEEVHSAPQYQCRSRFPNRNDNSAMAPRKTPKGI